MKKLTKKAISTSMAALIILPSFSTDSQERETNSANYWIPRCKYLLVDQYRGGFDVGFGVGVCAGMVDSISYFSRLLPEHMKSCKPEGVTNEQLIRVVITYIEARPARMHENIKDLIVEAFSHNWPCKLK
jgi:hypothetical protein